ncbi:MAG: SCO6745 family protein [Acidimicrobiales bacterium]
MSTVEPIVARKMHRTLEPYHGVVYFSPEAAARYRALGLADRQMGYFASRAAAMGPVPGEVVVATFFNFAPAEVLRCIPAAWDRATPAAVLEARLAGIDETLRRIIGDDLDGAEVAEAADLARTATEACTAEGRPLYAGHRSLPWPDPPHLVLWHALSLLREHRGDGHIAAMVVEGVDGCEALVIHGATGEVPAAVLQASRARTDDEWAAAEARLRDRGWLDADGALTEAGRAHRQWVEDRTDQLALAPWQHLGLDGCNRLRELVRPLSKAIVASGTLGFRPDQ